MSVFRSVIFIFLVVAAAACGDEPGYYISASGDDDNPGTKRRPFRTISRLNKVALKPGDAVYFMGPETYKGQLALQIDATKDAPVLITSVGETVATIDGGDSAAITIQGSGFVLRDLRVRGSGRKSGNTADGVSLIAARNGTVANLKIEGFQKSGLRLRDCRNIVVEEIYASENGFAGIYVEASKRLQTANIVVRDCHAVNNPGDPTNLTNHSGNGILIGMSDSVLVEYCTASNNGWDMPRKGNGPVGIWAYESEHVTIQHCISYANRTAPDAMDGGGFDFDGGVRYSVIQYCLSYDNEGSGYGLFQYDGASPWTDNVLRYCVSINDARSTSNAAGILVWNGSNDSSQLARGLVHNNLIISERAPAIAFEASSLHSDFRFFNNIFMGRGNVIDGPTSGERFMSNVWWRSSDQPITFRGYPNLAAWSAASGQERTGDTLRGFQLDPLLRGPYATRAADPRRLREIDAFRLRRDSPVIDKGIDLPGALEDFYGTKVPAGRRPEPGVSERQ